ncbi:MAG: hypothetical protein H7263_09475 [Candidatus Sericytochromatia bacterium]|nr:hypothetical protein [Candidatus Sericytochromatia bacterium]
MTIKTKSVKPDARGKVSLKEFIIKGTSGFNVTVEENGTLILKPFIEVDVSGIKPEERWIFENPKVLAEIKLGLKQIGEGKTVTRKSYAEYAEIKI